jgi:type II secretory pathway pseudopilin PulG
MSARAGVSLAEVLISMLIMSIGVVSLATLFPISVLRTAQASQLTHAVFLRNNAEAAIESNLGLLSNAQIPFINPTVYAVVDPLGANTVSPGLNSSWFTNVVNSVPRTSGGAGNLASAAGLAALPDSWSLVFEDTVTSYQASPLQVTTTTNTNNISMSGAVNYRVILYDVTGKYAQVYGVSSVSGTTLSSLGSLSGAFVPGRVRVEKQEFRYSYLLTVRKTFTPIVTGDSSWVSDLSVAVFYNRSFNSVEETAYSLSLPVQSATPVYGFDGAPGVLNVDDDGNGIVDYISGGGADPNEVGWLGSDDLRTVAVSVPAGSTPYLKKGSYMLETSMLQWYRITDINLTSGLVLLDQSVRFSPTTQALNGVFMKGIIEVFPLGSRTGQQ